MPSLVHKACVHLHMLCTMHLADTKLQHTDSCLLHDHAKFMPRGLTVAVRSAWKMLSSDLARLALCHSGFPQGQTTTREEHVALSPRWIVGVKFPG